MNRYCVIVPVYNHPTTLGWLVEQLYEYPFKSIFVNDGSDSQCSNDLQKLSRRHPEIDLIERETNSGKGAAVKTGIRRAAALGFTHAIQLDADGQHHPEDIVKFISSANQHPAAIICGEPVFENIPRLRFYGRYLTHILIWIHTWSLDIRDSLCGFRIYPVAATLNIINENSIGDRMDFDPEILVRLHWSGVKVVHVKTPVTYPRDGISHFRGVLDNLLISKMHIRLFFGMLLRFPSLLARKHGR